MRLRSNLIVMAFLECAGVARSESPYGKLVVVPESAGPFGVTMGGDPGKYKDCVPGRDAGTYICLSLPRPFATAQGYELEAWPGIGICKITMLGPNIPTGDDGTALRSNASSIADLIETVYGRYQKFNFSSATRHPDRDPYWMLHLLNRQQHYAYAWSKESRSNLKNNVEQIFLEVHAANISEGFVSVTFWSNRHLDCVANERRERAKAF